MKIPVPLPTPNHAEQVALFRHGVVGDHRSTPDGLDPDDLADSELLALALRLAAAHRGVSMAELVALWAEREARSLGLLADPKARDGA